MGGAAVTEEIYPGYKYSRASYLFSLFRPQIVRGQPSPSLRTSCTGASSVVERIGEGLL